MAEPITTTPFPITQAQLVDDLRALGVQAGMVLVLHSSLKSLGWVNGGAVAVILALEEVLTPEGTLVMPTHSADLSDPATWQNPPVPESWWEIIRSTMPAYDISLTPSYKVGVIPETFRKQDGVIRSANPDASFAAWGKHAEFITANHALNPLFGEQSPLARVYDLDGWVLLLGVGHGNNTSLHLAEYRANIPHRTMHTGSPMLIDGRQQWVAWSDIDWDDSDFKQLGADFAAQTGLEKSGQVGQATALLAPQRALVDYAVDWLERNRVAPDEE